MQKNAQDGYILFSWECNFYTDETLPYDIRRESNGFVKIDDVEKDCNILLEAGFINGAVEMPRNLPFDGYARKHLEEHFKNRIIKNRGTRFYYSFTQGRELESFSDNVKTRAWCSPRFNRADFRSKIKNTRFLTAVSIIPIFHIGHLDEDIQLRIWQFIRTNNRGDLAELAEIFETLDYGRKRCGVVFNAKDNKAVIIFPPIENGSKEEAETKGQPEQSSYTLTDIDSKNIKLIKEHAGEINEEGISRSDYFQLARFIAPYPGKLTEKKNPLRLHSENFTSDDGTEYLIGLTKYKKIIRYWIRINKGTEPIWVLKEEKVYT